VPNEFPSFGAVQPQNRRFSPVFPRNPAIALGLWKLPETILKARHREAGPSRDLPSAGKALDFVQR
jgi:hypothetical protein